MSTKLKILSYLVFFLIFLPPYGFAQIKIHQHITTEDGLIDNKILSMFQDSKGYLWFGTFTGISRWDGKTFLNLNKSDGLPSAAILDITELPDGTLLFSTYGRGFVTYKDGVIDTFNTKNGLSSNMVFRFQKIGNKTGVISDKIQIYKSNKINDFPLQEKSFERGISNVIVTEDGNEYVSSRIKGFFVKEGNNRKIFTVKDGLFSNKIYVMEKDFNNNILLGTYEGINKYKNGKISALKYNGKPIKGFVSDILVAKDGTIYYATEHGVVVEKENRVDILSVQNGLLENTVGKILEGDNGIIYFGYENKGVGIYHPNRFTNFISDRDPTKYAANSIIQTDDSKILLGTDEGLFDLSANQKIGFNQMTNNKILSLASNKNEIYVGTQRGFNIVSGNSIKKYYLGNKSVNGIYDIAVSYDGDILLAVRRQGIIVYTPNENTGSKFNNTIRNSMKIRHENVKDGMLTYISKVSGLQSSWVLDLLFTKDSTLVIGYHGSGVSMLKNGKFTHFKKESGLTDGIVTTIFEDNDGALWFGTRAGGISIYNNGLFDTLNIDHGLSSNNIRGIVQVGNKYYVTTTKGLNVVVKYPTGYFCRQINKNDGLVSNSCNRNALLLDNNNNIWIGTNDGLSKYNPAVDKIIASPPKIHFTGIKIFNEDYSLNEFLSERELSYTQNYLKFSFIGMNLSAPDKVLYKYRLKNVDKDWITSDISNVQYTSLDDGNYTFEVKARNEWGFWSKPKALSFVITPAWWETWWFYSLAILAIASLIAFVSSYRYRHLLAIEKMRSKISADLHDSVGSGLTEISILSELLIAQVPEDKKDFKSGLSNISTISRSLIESMSDIVWLVNPQKDTLKDLFKRLQMSYQEVLRYTDIDLVVENLDKLETVRLPMNFRQHLYLIFKEAINNAIKYSGGDLLNLKVQTEGTNLTVVFSDNGKGYDPNKEKTGNGLINMKNRAKEIGGKIEYFSVANKGTTIKFTGKFSKQKI